MNNYELTVVLAGSMPEAKQKAVVDKIKKAVSDSEGQVTKTDDWGKKNLAYKIAHEKEAFYYYLELSLSPDRTGGLARMIENDETVLRHLMVRTQNKVHSAQVKPVIDKKVKKTETSDKSTKKGKGKVASK